MLGQFGTVGIRTSPQKPNQGVPNPRGVWLSGLVPERDFLSAQLLQQRRPTQVLINLTTATHQSYMQTLAQVRLD
eukprot:6467197-Amphidinium_carterae.1